MKSNRIFAVAVAVAVAGGASSVLVANVTKHQVRY